MSYLPQSKFGDCVRCGMGNIDCRKRGKNFICLRCCNIEDTEKKIEKSKQRASLQRQSPKIRKLANPLEDNPIGSMQSLVNDLDIVFSRFIRLRYANKYGIVDCYCCGNSLHWAQMHNSHYIKRGNMSTRFSEYNCKQSCPSCNQVHNDNPLPYEYKLENEREGIVEYLKQLASEVHKFSLDELKEMTIDYRARVKLLESKLLINQK